MGALMIGQGNTSREGGRLIGNRPPEKKAERRRKQDYREITENVRHPGCFLHREERTLHRQATETARCSWIHRKAGHRTIVSGSHRSGTRMAPRSLFSVHYDAISYRTTDGPISSTSRRSARRMRTSSSVRNLPRPAPRRRGRMHARSFLRMPFMPHLPL